MYIGSETFLVAILRALPGPRTYCPKTQISPYIKVTVCLSIRSLKTLKRYIVLLSSEASKLQDFCPSAFMYLFILKCLNNYQRYFACPRQDLGYFMTEGGGRHQPLYIIFHFPILYYIRSNEFYIEKSKYFLKTDFPDA